MQQRKQEKEVCFEESEGLKQVNTFEELNLNPDLLKGIYALGFERPSLIQQKAILPIINRKDMIAQAQLDMDRVTIFSIGLLQLIDEKLPHCQGIIVSPTRELAQQINKIIHDFSQFLKIYIRCCIGLPDLKQDVMALKNGGIHIIISTPGRLMRLINKKIIKTDYLKMIVFDQADELLGRGFVEEVKQIFLNCPADIQVCMFSSTIPREILEMTDKFMKDPVKVIVKKYYCTFEGLKQYQISLQEESEKLQTLIKLQKNMKKGHYAIFVNRADKLQQLVSKLNQNNFIVSCISREMSVVDRMQALKEFKTGASRILILNDILGKGIEINQVELVINYDLPLDKARYQRRVGITSRFKRKRVVVNFVTPGDIKFRDDLREYFHMQIKELPIDVSNLME